MKDAAVILLVLGLLGATIALVSPSFREPALFWFKAKPKRIWIMPLFLTLHYALFSELNGHLQTGTVARLAFYFSAITLAAHYSRGKRETWNFVLISLLLVPPVLSLLPRYWGRVVGIDFPGGVFAISFYLLIVLPFWRDIDLKARWSLNVSDVGCIFAIYAGLFATIIPLGTILNFTHPGFTALSHTSAAKLLYVFVLGIFLKTGLAEELVFRGMIQNLILRKIRFVPGLLLSSAIFGITHVGQRTPNGLGTMFSFPNWRYVICATIAGVGYGYVYEKRRSLVGASLLHAMVDFSWKTFFSG